MGLHWALRFGCFGAACLLFWVADVSAQGITTNPKSPARPAATKKVDKPGLKRKTPFDPPVVTDKEEPAPVEPEIVLVPKKELPPEPAKPVSPLTPKIELHGGAWLFYYQPFSVPNETPFIRIQYAHLNFDGSVGDFGLFFNASVRDTKMREFYAGPAWLEEAYFYYKNPFVVLKVGKSYSRFGLLWENSFYGNVHFYDGIKLDPNQGISAEGSVGAEKGFRLGYYGQYFLVDGRTNGSYVGRDTISIPGARRRHITVVRAEPAYFWNKDTSLTLGVSGQYFQADMPAPIGKKDVARFAIDLSLNAGPVSVWAEGMRQIGQSVAEYPILPIPAQGGNPAIAGKASAHNDYLLVGGELRVWKLVGRYNLSIAKYADVGMTEFLHVPGIGLNLNDNLQFLVEYAHWLQRDENGNGVFLDRSLDTTIHGYF